MGTQRRKLARALHYDLMQLEGKSDTPFSMCDVLGLLLAGLRVAGTSATWFHAGASWSGLSASAPLRWHFLCLFTP